MKIGICSPLSIHEFTEWLDAESVAAMRNLVGLLAPAVDVLIKQYLMMGHDVVVFTLARGIDRPLVLSGKHLRIYVGNYRSNTRFRGLTFFWSEIRQLKSFIKREKIDIVHAQWTYEFAIAALSAKCPVICTVRDIAEEIYRINRNGYRFIRLLMNRYFFSRSREVTFIANSAYTAVALSSLHPNVDFKVVPNSISVPDSFVYRPIRKPPRIVTISNGWIKRKNILNLLLAFQLVKEKIPSANLVMVGGDFTEESENVRKLKKAGFPLEGVIWHGTVSHSKLVSVITSCDLMVHPSFEESFGNTLIESMASSVPVIGGCNSGAVPWVLAYGKAGFLCDVTSPMCIADAIMSILCDGKTHERLARLGYSHVRDNFSSENVSYRTLAIYKEVIGE